MGRTLCIAAAFVILAASWVSAGSFARLSEDAQLLKPTPLYLAPGAVVKAEFKSNVGRNTEMELESDALLPEPSSNNAGPQVTPKPAVAFRERRTGAMAPPPRSNQQQPGAAPGLAQVSEQKPEMDLDLEKDLVLSPPPRKTDERPTPSLKPVVEPKGGVPEEKRVEKQLRKKTPTANAKVRTAPPKSRYMAQRIRKVRPISQTAWNIPAGSHGRNGYRAYPDESHYRVPRRVACPPTTERFVRNGVTVRLAPTAVPPGQYPAPEYQPEYQEDLAGADLMSVAAEVISLPFAFISSLF